MTERLSLARMAHLYRVHFAEAWRERLFLASFAFFVTFALVRAITHAIRAGRGDLHNIAIDGTHVHHLVWGILLLLLIGYLWCLQIGEGAGEKSRRAARVVALLYGIGSALTLDEFALWLNLKDVYWARQGRESIDAIVLFGALLVTGVRGASFLRALAADVVAVARRAWRS